VAIDDVWQLSIIQSQLGSQYINRLYFIATNEDVFDISDFSALGILIKEIHRSQQNSTLTYTAFRARRVRGADVTWPTGSSCAPVGGAFFEGQFSSSTTGGLSGDALPPQCAMVTTLRTGQVGRRFRGRYYAAGWGETSNSGGTFDGSHVAVVSTAWGAFLATHAIVAPTDGFRVGVWSTRIATGCVPNPTGDGHIRVEDPRPDEAFTPITTHTTRPTVYTQRRRVVGKGT